MYKSTRIVNAANNGLLVDGAIHRAAGPKLLKECRTLGGCPTGEARITAGYNLPAKHVIHAVGPVYHPKSKRAPLQLAGCYRISLELAVQHGLKHIAFPAISTGIYSYPIEGAARVALGEVRKFLDTDEAKEFERVIFVVFSEEDEAVYLRQHHVLPGTHTGDKLTETVEEMGHLVGHHDHHQEDHFHLSQPQVPVKVPVNYGIRIRI
ncbi:hypothetical protein H4582DRAFT_2056555 [Lactarius indigo]|nr:hypothetical protein H4582DRAFT_2056555 [Lactarius indigo]